VGLTYLDNDPLSRVRTVPLYRERYVLVTHEASGFSGLETISWGLVAADREPLAPLPRALLDFAQGLDLTAERVCDVVTLNCPLHPETEHMIDARSLKNFKRGAYLINTARGKLGIAEDVAAALESGQLAGYAGDVWFPQPPPKDHPWRTMPHHGMTPHISGTSLSAQTRYAAAASDLPI
jgi:lactate dehydrogenase-like 2-hydroxyacid dehydrogenase